MPISKNPLYSIISFIIIIIGFGLILIVCLNQELLGLLLIIIYAGAISVVFLFIVMMLNIRVIELSTVLFGYLPLGLLFISILIYELVLLLWNNTFNEFFTYYPLISIFSIDVFFHLDLVENLVFLIFNYYGIWLLLISLILLVAMVGSIILTFRSTVYCKQQLILQQVARKVCQSVFIKKLCIY
jgi:NADH:ubiquinone oxidoreductase subunit 6 (subunit J)